MSSSSSPCSKGSLSGGREEAEPDHRKSGEDEIHILGLIDTFVIQREVRQASYHPEPRSFENELNRTHLSGPSNNAQRGRYIEATRFVAYLIVEEMILSVSPFARPVFGSGMNINGASIRKQGRTVHKDEY
jgi:hypothetical protein